MKKKIRDLTLGELHNLCKNSECCYECPLRNQAFCEPYMVMIDIGKELDNEIEVENEKEN